MAPMRLIGHRGASHVAPENTLGAFRHALECGAGIEMDLQLVRTGEVVVLHDETLRRTAPLAPAALIDRDCSELELNQLRAIDVGSWFGEEWSTERVPTFVNALELLREHATFCNAEGSATTCWPEGTSPHCYAELKADPDGSADPRLPEAAEAAVRSLGIGPELLSWITFSKPLAEEMKRRMPEYASLLVGHASTVEDAWSVARSCVQTELDGIDLNADPQIVTKELVDFLKGHGKVVAVWVGRAPATNDGEQMWEAMHRAGVHTFTSNLPPHAISWWRNHSSKWSKQSRRVVVRRFPTRWFVGSFAVGTAVSFMVYRLMLRR